jgi:hypothetical protein
MRPSTGPPGKPPTLARTCVVLAGKAALQAAVALLMTRYTLHPFLVNCLMGGPPPRGAARAGCSQGRG